MVGRDRLSGGGGVGCGFEGWRRAREIGAGGQGREWNHGEGALDWVGGGAGEEFEQAGVGVEVGEGRVGEVGVWVDLHWIHVG